MAGDEIFNRRKAWVPPKRPDWVTAVNREGQCLDLKGVVPLDSTSLIATAVANTGLSNFGSDDWREPFEVICKGLDEEAELNLMGRIMTRSEMLMMLEARLQVEEAYRRHPEIEDEVIEAPILIVGQGRSGTSALLNLMAADPENRVTRHWQVMFPCANPSAEEERRLIALAEPRIRMWSRVTPEIDSMHEFTAEIPTESIHVQTLSFQQPAWQFLYGQTPSHYAYMAHRSMVPAVSYEKRVLKLLQWGKPKKRWILKSPDSLNYLPDTLEVFSDMRLVWIHRDPVVSLSSMVSLVGTLAWIRSDKIMSEGTVEAVANPEPSAQMLTRPIEWIESGVINRNRLVNVAYGDLVSDPLRTVESIYDGFHLRVSRASREAVKQYVDEHPRQKRPAHRYTLGTDQNISTERRLFRRYQEYFGVPSEV